MYKNDVRIVFTHYRTGETILMEGILPEIYNPEDSDFYVLLKDDGTLEDIRKECVLSIYYIN